MKSGNTNFLEPSVSLQACNGTALLLPLTIIYTISAIRSFLPYIFKYFLQPPHVADPQVLAECGGHSSTPSQNNKKMIVFCNFKNTILRTEWRQKILESILLCVSWTIQFCFVNLFQIWQIFNKNLYWYWCDISHIRMTGNV